MIPTIDFNMWNYDHVSDEIIVLQAKYKYNIKFLGSFGKIGMIPKSVDLFNLCEKFIKNGYIPDFIFWGWYTTVIFIKNDR